MPRVTGAGQLRHRITIQSMTEVRDTTGQPIPTWADVATIWGLYEATGGFESSDPGEQVRSVVTGTVTIRSYPGLSPKMRLKVNGSGLVDLVLNIGAVMPPDTNTGFQVLQVAQPEAGVVQ